MVSCENLTLRVPGRVLARGVSLALEPGALWAVLGPNGSGKTTLLNALAGLEREAAAAVKLDGVSLAAIPARQRARAIGILLQQEEEAFWGTVIEYVLLGRSPHSRSWFGWRREDEECARAALATVELAPFAPRGFSTLSGGERQRARIAQVLAQHPRVFLLDEPLQHLDLKHQIRVLEHFRRLVEEGTHAVAMVLHDALWPARFCTHALLLYDDGHVVAGVASAVLTRANLERLYGCALAELRQVEGTYFVPDV
jgi:iron complex transport system ATP-binding protein